MIRCCNIIVFLGRKRDGNFTNGRTGFCSKLTFTWIKYYIRIGACGKSRQLPFWWGKSLTHYGLSPTKRPPPSKRTTKLDIFGDRLRPMFDYSYLQKRTIDVLVLAVSLLKYYQRRIYTFYNLLYPLFLSSNIQPKVLFDHAHFPEDQCVSIILLYRLF